MTITEDTITINAGTHQEPSKKNRRNAEGAKSMAESMLEQARKAAEAVEQFHVAADRIDRARAEEEDATVQRADALKAMKANKLSIVQMQELTGLSNSRIQAILRDS